MAKENCQKVQVLTFICHYPVPVGVMSDLTSVFIDNHFNMSSYTFPGRTGLPRLQKYTVTWEPVTPILAA